MNKILKPVIRPVVIVLSAVILGMIIYVPTAVSQDFSSYLNYNDMTAGLKNLVNANKGIAKIESIGKTLEGRDLWVITIANPAGEPLNERPAMMISSNFEGDHLIGSEISFAVIKYLLENYNSDEALKKSIDEHVYYILPRLNPDGAERMFDRLKTGKKTNMSPYDGDNDGRMDEDGPDDLNKDGLITMMRVKDEKGLFMINEDEPRLMKKADPKKGETGAYTIYWEGIDNDNDGFINEDPVGGVDINRNFMHEYPYFKDDAGWHMVSEKESKALMAWVIKHRNIAIMLNFGESDNLIIPPNSKGILSSDRAIDLIGMANDSYSEAAKVGMVSTGGGRRFAGMFRMGGDSQAQQSASSGRQRPSRGPETSFSTADLEYFNKASEMYRELTGIKTQPSLRMPSGAFFQYGYFQFGVLSLSTPGWGMEVSGDAAASDRRPSGGERAAVSQTGTSAREGRAAGSRPAMPSGMPAQGGSAGKGIDQDYISYLDKNEIKGFVDWQPFTHPELGELEIGGFTPYEINNPPASQIAGLGESHAKFAVWLSGLYADVKIAKTEVINHGGGLFRIKAEIENTGFLPTSLNQGVTSRSVSPTMVQLGVDPETIISGSAKTSFFQALDGSGKRQEYEWVIKGKQGDKIDLKVVAQKAGTDKISITLK